MAPGSYAPIVDAATATALLELAEDARARARQQDPDADRSVEDRYPEMLEALDWHLARAAEAAFRLASALVPFWISTKRIDDGDAWFERALETAAGGDAARARALYDHGYLVFWAGRYELAERAVHRVAGVGGEGGRPLAPGARPRRVGTRRVEHRRGRAVRLLRQALSVTEGLADSDRAVQRPARAGRGAADVGRPRGGARGDVGPAVDGSLHG